MEVKAKHYLPLAGLLVLMVIQKCSLCDAAGLSPSFPRQEITDTPNDWRLMLSNQGQTVVQTKFSNMPMNFLRNETECLSDHQYTHPPDIDGVSYLSDGKMLNATLWLSDTLNQLPSIPNSTILQSTHGEIPYIVLYGMSLTVHSAYDIPGKNDYALYLRKEASMNSWNKTLIEHSAAGEMSSGEYRSVDNSEIKRSFSSYFGNGTDEIVPWKQKGYVNLSLDLARLNYPDQYDLFFYTYDFFIKNGQLCRLDDATQRVFVPPPQFALSTLPASVELRPGEETNIQVQIKANTNLTSPQVLLYSNSTNGIGLHFNSNRTAIPSSGVSTSHLNIKIPQYITPAPYTLPIFANVSIPMDIKLRRSIATGEVLNSLPQNLSRVSYLTVIVNQPLRWDEQIKDFWDKLGSPITFIYGIIAVAVPWILNDIRKKLKKRNRKRPIERVAGEASRNRFKGALGYWSDTS
jgi:hypothetical protein